MDATPRDDADSPDELETADPVDPRADTQADTGEDPGTGGPADRDGDGVIDRIG